VTSKPWSLSTVIVLTCVAVVVVTLEEIGLPQPRGYWADWWPPPPILAVTILALAVYSLQLWQMIRTANAAVAAANAASTTLTVTNRAWLKISGDLGPITYERDRIITYFSPIISNEGNAPATNVTLHVWLGVVTPDTSTLPTADDHRRFDQIAGSPPTHGWTLFPESVFPDAVFGPYRQGMLLPREKMEAGRDPCGKRFRLYLVGCVAYDFPSDRGRNHLTPFFYEVRLKDGDLLPLNPPTGMITPESHQIRYIAGGILSRSIT
jgi:hypothetical protein